MSICILVVTATGADLSSNEALGTISAGFRAWYADDPADIGIHTRSVLGERSGGASRGAGESPPDEPADLLRASQAIHQRTGHSAGNGALMRTGVVGLTRLWDRQATAEAERAVAKRSARPGAWRMGPSLIG